MSAGPPVDLTRVPGLRVEVPATSANLGPGFDTFGIALDLHDVLEVRPAADGLRITVQGEGADELPRDDSHLVVRAMRRTLQAAGRALPPLELRCTNRIPHARGLGSSAAAIVAGVAAAQALLRAEAGAEPRGDAEAVFEGAADIEGHPDNVAPCVFGGAALSWGEDERWRAVRRTPSSRVRPVVCVPEERQSTEQARGLLPAQVPHGDAVFTAGRAALLDAALTDRCDLLLPATEDRLHQGYRARAMPDTARLIERLRGEEGLAAVLSGAGPSVLVLAAVADDADETGDAIASVADSIRRHAGKQWHVRPSRIDPAGVRIGTLPL